VVASGNDGGDGEVAASVMTMKVSKSGVARTTRKGCLLCRCSDAVDGPEPRQIPSTASPAPK